MSARNSLSSRTLEGQNICRAEHLSSAFFTAYPCVFAAVQCRSLCLDCLPSTPTAFPCGFTAFQRTEKRQEWGSGWTAVAQQCQRVHVESVVSTGAQCTLPFIRGYLSSFACGSRCCGGVRVSYWRRCKPSSAAKWRYPVGDSGVHSEHPQSKS